MEWNLKKEKRKKRSCFSLDFWTCLLKIDDWKWQKKNRNNNNNQKQQQQQQQHTNKQKKRESCHFLPSRLCQWRHEQDRHVWQSGKNVTSSSLFSSALLHSELTCLCPEEHRLDAVKYLLCKLMLTVPLNESCRLKRLHILYLFRPNSVFASVQISCTRASVVYILQLKWLING